MGGTRHLPPIYLAVFCDARSAYVWYSSRERTKEEITTCDNRKRKAEERAEARSIYARAIYTIHHTRAVCRRTQLDRIQNTPVSCPLSLILSSSSLSRERILIDYSKHLNS